MNMNYIQLNMETLFLHIHNRDSRKTLSERKVYLFINIIEMNNEQGEYCLLVD